MLLGIKRGVIQFCTVTVLGGAFLVLGIDPAQIVAAFVANPPDWLGHPAIRIVAFFGGGGFVYLAWKFWPWSPGRKLTSKQDFNVPIRDLVRYVRFESQWGVRSAGRLVAYPDECSVLVILRNKAAADEIEIHGIREIQDSPRHWSVIWQDCRNDFPDYWRKMEFAPRCLLGDHPKEPETEPENPYMSPRYPDHTLLRACWSEILEAWLRASSLDIQVKAGLADAPTVEETVAPSQPARERRQTEAITDDNPTGTWEWVKEDQFAGEAEDQPEFLNLCDAAVDAWERIRKLPEFDEPPPSSPQFDSRREYYEAEPAKMLGIVAQVIFNSADPPIPIKGISPPRTVMEIIPADKAAGYGFSDDATELFDWYDKDKPPEQHRRYISLQVKRADIERRVKAIEEDNGKG